MRVAKSIAIAVIASSAAIVAAAGDGPWPLAYEGLCGRATYAINVLIEHQTTICETVKVGEKIVMMFGTSVSVFSTDKTRRGWGLVVLVSAGKVMRDSPQMRVDELRLTDLESAKSLKQVRVSASFAQSLQAGISSGKISTADGLEMVDAAMKLESVLSPK